MTVPVLYVKSELEDTKYHLDPEDGIITIGRAPENHIQLPDTTTSRVHAKIVRYPRGWTLEDAQSRNGIVLNDKPVSRQLLKTGDVISIGPYNIIWEYQPAKLAFDRDDDLHENASITENTLIVDDLLVNTARRPTSATDNLEKNNKVLYALYRITQQIQASEDFQSLFKQVLELLFEITAADFGMIVLEDDQRELIPKALKFRDAGIEQRIVPSLSKTIRKRIFEDKDSILMSNIKDDLQSGRDDSIFTQGIKSIMAVPLFNEEDVIGLIQLSSYSLLRSFSKDDLNLLHAISHQLSSEIHAFRLKSQNLELIDELKETNRNLKDLVKKHAETIAKLEKSEQVKRTFMATISHELKTPINGIVGTIELLKIQHELPASSLETLKAAENSANRLTSLIDDIICFSDAESGNYRFDKTSFTIPADLDGVIEHFRDMSLQKGLEFRLEIDPALTGSYFTDTKKLEKIISHLLDNAVKFTEEGWVELAINHITQAKADTTNADVEIQVSDSGPGIPKEKFGKVKQVFQQGDSTFSRVYGGMGIGLPICYALSRVLKGQLTFDSGAKGSRFSLLLTLEKSAAERQERIKETSMESHNILIVEDNIVNQMVLQKLVMALGHNAFKARHGKEALTVFKENPIDLIFMDCQMPVMDGFAATEAIRECDRTVPIIAITANFLESEKSKCLEVGMNDFQSKPINKDIVHRLICRWSRG